jgi:hypothetical protein
MITCGGRAVHYVGELVCLQIDRVGQIWQQNRHLVSRRSLACVDTQCPFSI